MYLPTYIGRLWNNKNIEKRRIQAKLLLQALKKF